MTVPPNSLDSGPLAALTTRERRWLIARSFGVSLASLTAILLAYYLAPWDRSGTLAILLRVLLALVIVVVVTTLAVQVVGRADYPLLRLIESLTVVVGFAVVSFASLYVLVSSNDVASFSEPLGRTDALYFSLTTMTTVGFGDINAKSELARVLVMLQMVTNVVVVGIAARVLVHAARRRSGP